MKYEIRRSGPDNRSTYAECFGRLGELGTLIARTRTAEGARLAVVAEGGWGGLDAYLLRGESRVALRIQDLREAASREREQVPDRTVWD